MRYAGHLFTSTGLRVDPTKVIAVEEMPTLSNKASVRRLLGMVNYLSPFVPQLADMAEPLRALTKDTYMFQWESAQQQAWMAIKQAISTATVLCCFDAAKETELHCNASSIGLGAALLQEGQPVAYASRALTQTEQGCAQLEKELLAVVFGMQKFRQYVYRRQVMVTSDHKRLETIDAKPLVIAPKRLQRMFLALQEILFTIR